MFCSYGSVPCPPIQAERSGQTRRFLLCGVIPHGKRVVQSSRDWRRLSHERVGVVNSSSRDPCCSIIPAGGANRHVDHRAQLDGDSLRSQCKTVRRTHCRYAGPYSLAMIAAVLVLASGIASADFYAWLALAVLILGGSMIIWWATERAWGRFS